MKRLLTFMLLAFVVSGAYANNVAKEANVTDLDVKRKGNDINVTFGVDVGKRATNKNHRLVLVPVIYKGGNEREMTPIVVESKRLLKIDKRKHMSFRDYETPYNGAVKTLRGGDVWYDESVPYESWMNGASVRLDRYSDGCGKSKIAGQDDLLSGLSLFGALKPSLSNVKSKSESGQVSKAWGYPEKEMMVHFKQAKTNIETGLFNNTKSLNEIVEAIKAIQNDSDLNLDKIEITGFASPEGGLANNIRLGENRAKALQTYMLSKTTGISASDFHLINGEENWEGLRAMVEASSMAGKADVLKLMNSTTPNTNLKEKLQKLNGGAPYKYMYNNFFPTLRSASKVRVMYSEKVDKKDTAAETINGAISLINSQQYDKALTELQKVKDDVRSFNAQGVVHMMKGDLKTAKTFFDRAINSGDNGARENLKQIIDRLK